MFWNNTGNYFPVLFQNRTTNLIQLLTNIFMHKTLINRAFYKAKSERQIKGEKKPSLTSIAEDLASFVKKSDGLRLDEKNYRNYFSEAKKKDNTTEDISIKQLKVINGLCKFLGFTNYEDFTNSLGGKPFGKTLVYFFNKNKMILIVLFTSLVSLLVCSSVNRQRWMVWNNDRYVEASFDVEKYDIGELKLYNEAYVKYFNKIRPTWEAEVFTVNNKVKFWYRENKKKELRFFAMLEFLPETGRTLDPIAEYMIKIYIYPSY